MGKAAARSPWDAARTVPAMGRGYSRSVALGRHPAAAGDSRSLHLPRPELVAAGGGWGAAEQEPAAPFLGSAGPGKKMDEPAPLGLGVWLDFLDK